MRYLFSTSLRTGMAAALAVALSAASAASAAEGGGTAAVEGVAKAGGRRAHELTLTLFGGQRVFSLGERFIFEGSLSIAVDGVDLSVGSDYIVDHTTGTVLLRRTFPEGATLLARFDSLPFDLLESYAAPVTVDGRGSRPRGGPGEREDSTPEGAANAGSASKADREGGARPALKVGGSKRLAFELGSGRDVTISQSLDLDITGRVGKDVEVRAVLSDRNLPVLPEGNTQSLEELDEVYVKISSPSLHATFGDYTLTGPRSEFAGYSRTVEGVQASASRGDQEISVATASPRGKFESIEFMGEEGKQGAYHIAAEKSGATIVPGSEKVWLDGELLRRGGVADYTIDYASATITFTSARPITKDSRITVDYEYSYEDYKRSLYSVVGRTSRGSLKLTASYASESDDRSSALGGEMTEEQKSRLEGGGDALADAALPDTSAAADGGTAPIRPPSSHDVVDLAVSYSAWEALSLETEVALSDLDLNTFSSLDDADNKGGAYGLKARLSPRSLSAGGVGLGSFEMSASVRATESSFSSMGRTRPALDYDSWNLSPESLGGGERRSRLSMTYRPAAALAVGADFGHISLDGGGSSNVMRFSSSAAGPRGYDLSWERAESEVAGNDAGGSGLTGSRRERGAAKVRWSLGPVAPAFEAELERRTDGDRGDGANYNRVGGEVRGGGGKLSAIASLYVRNDYISDEGLREKASDGLTQSYGVSYRDGSKLGLDGRYSLRSLSVDSTGARLNTYVAHFDGVGSQFKGALGWRGTYEVTSTDEGPRTTVFVGPGKGHYDENGRYVGIGDYELSESGGDSPLSSRVALNFSSDLDWGRAGSSGPGGGASAVLRALRWSGLYRLEEHTRAALASPSMIFHAGSYMNPDDVIRGNSTFRQEIEVLPRGVVISPQVRYEVRRQLQNTGAGLSGARLRTVSLRLRTRALPRATVEAEQVWGVSSTEGSQALSTGTEISESRSTSETRAGLIVRPDSRTNLSFESSYSTDRSRDAGGGSRWQIAPAARYSVPGVASFEAGCKWARANRRGAASYDQLLGWLGSRVEYSLSGQVGLGGGLTLTGTLRATGIDWGDLSHYMRMEMRALF
jgi:hypothetical protein